MEDLVPLLIFIAIAVINILKYVTEKGGRKPPAQPQEKPGDDSPGTLDDFFREIERKFQPQPRELPDWPETIERPDYVREMEDYETAQTSAVPAFPTEAPVQKVQEVIPEPAKPVPVRVDATPPKAIGKTATFKIPTQGAVFSGLSHMRISTPPLLRSAAGYTNFELNTREQLKRALLAGMVFGQPRAYDNSFHTTLAK